MKYGVLSAIRFAGCSTDPMSIPLLSYTLDAHGGMKRWMQFLDFVTDVTVEGDLCSEQGQGRIARSSRLLLSLRGQRSITLLPDGLEPLLVSRGVVSQLSPHLPLAQVVAFPESISSQDVPATEPAAMRTGYFMGNVIRYALMAPFLYASEATHAEEVEPWIEDGETWRVLKVTLPADQVAPCQVQYAYIGEDGLIRRTRNDASLIGASGEVVNYVDAYVTVDGIKIPRSRSVFSCDPSGRKIETMPLARIIFSNSFFTD